jgi:uncharacterized protein (UPF0332 family)
VTPPSVPEQIQDLWKKANESLDASSELLEKHHEEFAVSRAYYAMFYVTEALLLTKNLVFAKHSGVIASFGQHFVKTGIFKVELREMLAKAFEDRTEGDYGMTDAFSPTEAKVILGHAQKYCQILGHYLTEKGHIQ